MIYTAAYTGLRWGELAGLRVERVNVLRRSIAVVEQLNELSGKFSWGPPKTNAGRRAVSLPGARFVVGVQWHPEYKPLQNPFSRSLFDAFAQACHATSARTAAKRHAA